MLSEIEYVQILNSTLNPVLVASPVYDGDKIIDFVVEYVNPPFFRITNRIADTGVKFSEITNALPESLDWINYATESIKKDRDFDITYYAEHCNTWFLMTIGKTKNDKCVFLFTDVNTLKKAQSKFTQQMHTDMLTGIANRTYFNQIFDNIVEKATRENMKIGIMVIDVDNMKSINDMSGHVAGDSVLRRCAHILEKFEDDKTQVFRLGDDEFLVLVIDLVSRNRMVTISDAVFEAFHTNNISVSAGIALFPADSSKSSDLLKSADLAVKLAKKNGKNTMVFFEPSMYEQFLRHSLLQEKLFIAMQNNSFALYYQPQFYIATNTLRGFEALIRWHDEASGWVAPEEFIPIAEEMHLIAELGMWIIETGCAALKEWQTKYDFKGVLSLNVSPSQLKDSSFIVKLECVIEKYGIAPGTLEIEITEGLLIDNIKNTVALLQQIRDMGVLIALDDFGTGYASFKYLQYLPVDTLKIDKSFIDVLDDRTSAESNIVAAIISLVSNMNISTIAEGIEHNEQLSLLRKMKCTIMQGYLRGKPMEKALCDRLLGGDKTALLRTGDEPLENINI